MLFVWWKSSQQVSKTAVFPQFDSMNISKDIHKYGLFNEANDAANEAIKGRNGQVILVGTYHTIPQAWSKKWFYQINFYQNGQRNYITLKDQSLKKM